MCGLRRTPAELTSKVVSERFPEISCSVINMRTIIHKFGKYLKVSKHIRKCLSAVSKVPHDLQVATEQSSQSFLWKCPDKFTP